MHTIPVKHECACELTHTDTYIHPHSDTQKSCSNAAQEYIPFKVGSAYF